MLKTACSCSLSTPRALCCSTPSPPVCELLAGLSFSSSRTWTDGLFGLLLLSLPSPVRVTGRPPWSCTVLGVARYAAALYSPINAWPVAAPRRVVPSPLSLLLRVLAAAGCVLVLSHWHRRCCCCRKSPLSLSLLSTDFFPIHSYCCFSLMWCSLSELSSIVSKLTLFPCFPAIMRWRFSVFLVLFNLIIYWIWDLQPLLTK